MSWKDLKIAKKLYIGFGVVLILAAAVGYVGWNGLSEVAAKVENVADAKELVMSVKDMGAARVAFTHTQDKKHYQTVQAKAAEMGDLIESIKARFEDQADIALANEAVKKVQQYEDKWGQWVSVAEDDAQARADITADANVAQGQFFALRDDQKSKLVDQVGAGLAHKALSQQVAKTNAANDILGLWLDLRVAYRNYLIFKDEKYAQQLHGLVDGIVAQGEQVRGMMTEQANIEQINTIITASKGISNSMKTVVAKAEESEAVAAELAVVAKEVVAVFDRMREGQEQQMKSAESLAVTMAISFVIGAILLGAAIAFFIARGVSRPVSMMAAIAEDISEGNIQHNIDYHSKDEVGMLAEANRKLITYMQELAEAAENIANNNLTIDVEPKSSDDVLGVSFKTMIVNLSDMVRQLTDNANQLVSAANEISSAAEQASKGSEEQAQQVSQVSTAVEEMTATIVQSSRNAAEATEASKNASEQASTGGQIVNETIQGMQRIAKASSESAEMIATLAQSADQIGEIVGVIDDIADQTNLLALNAAIEAARAGEQGRGFAVVADEVRKLAERTGKATGEITDMIKGIQEGTNEAVQSMEAGGQEVTKGRELTDQAGNSLTEIVTGVDRVMDMIQQIATAAEEQSTAAEQISKNVENVNTITKETAAGAEQSAAASEELSRQAEGLRQMIARFQIKTDSVHVAEMTDA